MKYHIESVINQTEDGRSRITVSWLDESDAVICSGSAVVSRAPEEYVQILAADIRDINGYLFIADATEGEVNHEV